MRSSSRLLLLPLLALESLRMGGERDMGSYEGRSNERFRFCGNLSMTRHDVKFNLI
jgi:hypothetical protein